MKPLIPTFLSFFAILVACDTPKFGFKYDAVKEVSAGGNDYKVYYSATRAQAVRTNNVGLRKRQAAVDYGVVAIEMASGCVVRRLDPKTDPSLIIAFLKC